MQKIALKILFVVVLMAGQLAYAEHMADFIGEHHHTTDCALCFAQVNVSHTATAASCYYIEILSLAAICSTPLFSPSHPLKPHNIRAPPFQQQID